MKQRSFRKGLWFSFFVADSNDDKHKEILTSLLQSSQPDSDANRTKQGNITVFFFFLKGLGVSVAKFAFTCRAEEIS